MYSTKRVYTYILHQDFFLYIMGDVMRLCQEKFHGKGEEDESTLSASEVAERGMGVLTMQCTL
jgi:hypothetical protein